MTEERKVLEVMEKEIMNAKMAEKEKSRLMKNFLKFKDQKINLMITGATGSGKSSTINALFDMEVAKVGVGTDPETMDIEKYELDNLVLWDTPGLGDGKDDERHSKNIIKKLNERDENGDLLIDLVLVVLDGGSRDLGTSYKLINEVIIPNLGEEKKNRLLVAINQADAAMKGRFWDYEENKPEPQLEAFLEEKSASVRRRIKEGTGMDVEPIYYSAGFKEESCAQERPYNLSKLLYYIVNCTPKKKRVIYLGKLNQDENAWKDDDRREDYKKGTWEKIKESVEEFVEWVADCPLWPWNW